MKFILIWSHKGQEHHWITDDLKTLGDPLRQIYENRKDKSNCTSMPKIYKADEMKITPVDPEKGLFQIEEV